MVLRQLDYGWFKLFQQLYYFLRRLQSATRDWFAGLLRTGHQLIVSLGSATILSCGLALLGRCYQPGARQHLVFALFAACAPSQPYQSPSLALFAEATRQMDLSLEPLSHPPSRNWQIGHGHITSLALLAPF